MDTDDKALLEKLNRISKIRQFQNASNAVFLIDFEDSTSMVFKPSSGERPLWDFESGSLCRREYLASQLYPKLGVHVPKSYFLEESPVGTGIIMDYLEFGEPNLVQILHLGVIPEGEWLKSFEGVTEDGKEVILWHKDSQALRDIALADHVMNNADRKVSHIGETVSGLIAIDHGLTFHADPKVRTFLWGWQGTELRDAELARLLQLEEYVTDIGLTEFISEPEIDALTFRITELIKSGVFPSMPTERSPLPWPIF